MSAPTTPVTAAPVTAAPPEVKERKFVRMVQSENPKPSTFDEKNDLSLSGWLYYHYNEYVYLRDSEQYQLAIDELQLMYKKLLSRKGEIEFKNPFSGKTAQIKRIRVVCNENIAELEDAIKNNKILPKFKELKEAKSSKPSGKDSGLTEEEIKKILAADLEKAVSNSLKASEDRKKVETTEKKKMSAADIAYLKNHSVTDYVMMKKQKGEAIDPKIERQLDDEIIRRKIAQDARFITGINSDRSLIDNLAGDRLSNIFHTPKYANASRIVDENRDPKSALFQVDKSALIQRYENTYFLNQEVKPYMEPFRKYTDLGQYINSIGFRNTNKHYKTPNTNIGFKSTDPIEPYVPGIANRLYQRAMTQ